MSTLTAPPMAPGDAARINAGQADVMARHRRAVLWPAGLLALVCVYLIYAFIAFDVPGLIAKSRLDRGVLLASIRSPTRSISRRTCAAISLRSRSRASAPPSTKPRPTGSPSMARTR
jgi:hypothetical protein